MSTISATNSPRIAAPDVRAITIRTLSKPEQPNSLIGFRFQLVLTVLFDGYLNIANIDDKRYFAQVGVQKTLNFGQNDGATGAGLHHFGRKSDVYLNVRSRYSGFPKADPNNTNGAALATPLG